jgi:uncharacterized protein (UPF0371 family)
MIDSFHLEKYGQTSVNYNRDLELFPVLKKIIEKITKEESIYQSPTDMGVNRVGFGIVDDEVVREAAKQEIIRRYFKTVCEYKKGQFDKGAYDNIKMIMEEVDLKPEDRNVVLPARNYSKKLKETAAKNDTCPVVALELNDGTILTGKGSSLMNASAAAILNAVKYISNIADEMHLISPSVLEPILNLKTKTLASRNPELSCEEVLMALSICAVTNPIAQVVMDNLSMLKGAQAHSTTILSKNDEQTFRELGIDVTCDPEYPSKNLYYAN